MSSSRAVFVPVLLVLATAPVCAHDAGRHDHGTRTEASKNAQGTAATHDDPPAASLGGAISPREEAGKGGNSQKGETAEGLRPR